MMGEDVVGGRDEWERERAKREEKREREEMKKREEEHTVWEKGSECIWEVVEEKEEWERYRAEKMGSARTRGRREEDAGLN